MYLKRIYKKGSNELDYLSLAHTGIRADQNFSVKLVTELVGQGLMEIKGETLVLHTHPEDLRYKIKRQPGRYCLHCGEKLPDDANGQLARLHIAMQHAGKPSPSKEIPAGYIALNHFECVLDAKQHEKYRLKQPARAFHFPTREEA